MEPTQAKNIEREPKATRAIEGKVEEAEVALRERAIHARDLVEDLRERAEIALHERPYLLPAATGALGFGLGLLVGSKLSRIILFTAAGALLSDKVRGQVIRMSRDMVRDLVGGREEEEEELEHEHEMPSAV